MTSAQQQTNSNQKKNGGNSNVPVGEILRRTRVKQGYSLEQVESVIRIKASQLEAVERMDFDKLPGWVYVTGFVRNYAEFLGLSGDKVLALLKKQAGPNKKNTELAFPVSGDDNHNPNIWIFAAALVVLIGAVGYFTIFAGSDRSMVEDIPDVPIEEDVASPGLEIEGEAENQQTASVQPTQNNISSPSTARSEAVLSDDPFATVEAPEGQSQATTQSTITPPSEPENTPAPVKSDQRIIINVTAKSWVEIRNEQGQRVVSRILNPGDAYFVPSDKPGMVMTTGNAGGLEVTVDGQELGPLGDQGDIRRNIQLDPDSLKNLY